MSPHGQLRRARQLTREHIPMTFGSLSRHLKALKLLKLLESNLEIRNSLKHFRRIQAQSFQKSYQIAVGDLINAFPGYLYSVICEAYV